ncbi:MAG: hypothetical protein KDH09_19975, partial [Chrysiogenetes bacterium]|nr:hypothetical protein [Chrysiogenetes bacterium]
CAMSPTFTEVLRAHVGYQFHNTLDHLLVGLMLCALLMSLGLPWLRAVAAVALFALAREFLWQYPLRDAFALKFYDRILDSAEFALGAASAAWLSGGTLLARIEGVLIHVFNLVVRAALFALAQIRHVPGLLGSPASPVAR